MDEGVKMGMSQAYPEGGKNEKKIKEQKNSLILANIYLVPKTCGALGFCAGLSPLILTTTQ